MTKAFQSLSCNLISDSPMSDQVLITKWTWLRQGEKSLPLIKFLVLLVLQLC